MAMATGVFAAVISTSVSTLGIAPASGFPPVFAVTWDDQAAHHASETEAAPQDHCAGYLGKDGFMENSTVKAPWSQSADSSSFQADGSVLIYLRPEDSRQTQIVSVDPSTKTVKQTVNIDNSFLPGEMHCLPNGECYAFHIIDEIMHSNRSNRGRHVAKPEDGALKLIQVDPQTGSVKNVAQFSDFIGYQVGSSTLDVANKVVYAAVVGKAHDSPTGKSDLWLAAINLTSLEITSKAPMGRDFGGPLMVAAPGLLSFGTDLRKCQVASVDVRSGKQTCISVSEKLGTVLDGASTSDGRFVAAYSVHPSTTVFVLDVRRAPFSVVDEITFNPVILHAFAYGLV